MDTSQFIETAFYEEQFAASRRVPHSSSSISALGKPTGGAFRARLRRRRRITASNETAKTALKSLFHLSIGPNYYWDHAAISAGLVQHYLAQFHPAFFVRDAFSIPLSEKFYTRITSADGVHNGNLHVHSLGLSAIRQLKGSRQEHAHLLD